MPGAVPAAALAPEPCPLPRCAPRHPLKMRRALRCVPRRLCLLLLLLLTAALRTSATALGRRDRLDSLDSGRGGGEFYHVQDTDRYCKKCPPGTHVVEHCKEQHGSSKCSPCNKNEFIEYPNDFPKCLGCQICREDQVELSPCQAARNTQCACKNGTFCSPDHPCEMCQKCRPRCAKGEVELAPCTPYSDRRCGLPAGTPSSSSGDTMLIVGVVVTPIVLILVSCVVRKYCCHQSAGDRTGVGSKPRTAVDSLVRQLTRCCGGGPGTQDNILNEQLSQDQLPLRASGVETSSSPGPEAKPKNNLVPVPGKDPVILLQRSFDTFAEFVPSAEWRRYGRALDLLENDIDIAMKNHKYSRESFFQMLKTWHDKKGMNASVNTLLDTLQEMNLGGVAQEVSTKLVKQELFQYEER